jgi:hypothetical protein
VRRDGDVAWKIHLYHLTSHLGDEYVERTGAKQVAYHLEEAAAGISWDIGTGSRIYGEAGATIYGGETTGNGRLQCGFEWVGAREATGLSPFFAADLQAKNEQDWTPSFTIATGIAYGRHVRIGAEYFQGRDPHTQFLAERERWVAIVLSFDY